MQTVDFPSDITILFSNHYLEYEDGTRANATNGVYSHRKAAFFLSFAKTNIPDTFYMDLSRRWKSAW
jgi:hypothetical protein